MSPGTAEPTKASKETDEEMGRKNKKKQRSERRENAKSHFEGKYPGSLWGSDRVAPSDQCLEMCVWEPGEPPEWHHWSLYMSVEEVDRAEMAKREKKELESKKQKKKRHKDDSSDEEETSGLKFEGGLWKAQAILELRRKVVSGRGLVHLEALALYDQSLLDATLREPPEGFRYPSANEVMKADKAAWAEVSRLVRSKEASVEAAFAHVAKPGGLLWGIIRPVDKKTTG